MDLQLKKYFSKNQFQLLGFNFDKDTFFLLCVNSRGTFFLCFLRHFVQSWTCEITRYREGINDDPDSAAVVTTGGTAL